MHISEKPIIEFKHSTSLSKTKEFIALNNRFPSLKAYGIVMCLYEMYVYIPHKVKLDDAAIDVFCHEYQIERKFFMEVLEFCVNTIKIFEYSQSQYLYCETLQKHKNFVMADRKNRLNAYFLRKDFRAKQPKRRVITKIELPLARRQRIIKHFKKILLLTEDMLTKYEHAFRHLGDITVFWSDFVLQVCANYEKMYTVITEDNYPLHFEAYLNTCEPLK